MANVGTAQLTITPKFDNLSASVNKALSGVDASKGSARLGSGISDGVSKGLGGLIGSGALVGAFSTITTKAMDAIGSHVGSAAARLDTLKNYPTVMQQLGISSDEANSSIQTMSDRLSNLPTRLDTMASTVQGLYAATKDYGVSLTTATDAGLALNDMLLAGGQGTAVTSAAMEQFRQMLAKGKPDMQDWRSLLSAAPGQMDQLAKSMLGPTATANDLYAALGGGGAEATVSMSELLDAMIQLDQQGGNGLASLSDQAEQATGGIQTAMDNASNAITKGIANVLDSIGRENIAGAINDVKGMISDAFGDLSGVASAAAPAMSEAWGDIVGYAGQLAGEIKGVASTAAGMLPPFDEVRSVVRGVLDVVVPLAPAIAGIVVAQKGVSAGVGIWNGVSGAMAKVGGVIGKIGSGVTTLGEKVFDGASALGGLSGAAERAGLGMTGLGGGISKVAGVLSGPWGVAIAAGAVGVGLLVSKIVETEKRNEEFAASMDGVSDAVAKANGLSSYSDTLSDVGDVAKTSGKSLDDLVTSINDHERAIGDSLDAAQEQIAVLDTAQGIIEGLAGKTDLTTEEQGKLKWALSEVNDQLGTSITESDVAADSYEDQNGNVQDLTDSLGGLIEAKKEEARQTALASALTDAYKAQYEAAGTLADKQAAYNDLLSQTDDKAQQYYDNMKRLGHPVTMDEAQAWAEASNATSTEAQELQKAQEAYDATTQQVDSLTTALGDNAQAADTTGDAYSSIGSGMQYLEATLTKQGQSLGDFRGKLEELGASTDDLASMSEDDLAQLVQGWDGSTEDLLSRLSEMGVGVASAKVSAEQFADAMGAMLGGLSGDQIEGALGEVGVSMDDFKTKCDEAGISSSDFSNISQEQFAAMVGQCGGDVDTLIAEIQAYNDVPIVDKDGNVSIDQAQLYDAQGNVYVWNGTELVNKETGVACDSQQLIDGQGHVWTWNASDLKLQDAQANVEDSGLTDAQGNLWTWNGSDLVSQRGDATVTGNLSSALGWMRDWNAGKLVNQAASATVSIFQNVFGGGKKSGGNARGGVVRGHATGAVFTRPTWISATDYIGEAGPEYYDGTNIVPLTSKYGQPFANVIADGVARRMAGSATTNNVYIDGARLNDDDAIDSRIDQFVSDMIRFGVMIRG